MNKEQEMLEKAFTPDIRVKLDKDSRIISAKALTKEGAFFMLHKSIYEEYYDLVLQASAGWNICFEVESEDEQ